MAAPTISRVSARPSLRKPVARRVAAWRAARMVALYLPVCVVALLMVFPIVWMLSTASKPLAETATPQFHLLPSQFLLWQNLVGAFEVVPMARFFANSVIVAAAHVVGQVALASLAGYSFAKYTYPGRDIVFGVVLATMMIPFFVVVIPLYIVVYSLGWLNTYWALIVPGLVTGFGIFLMRQFMLTIPSELIDAGRIDGASEFGIFWRVVLPLCGPALATLSILTFLEQWDSYVWPLLVINQQTLFTMPLGLALFLSSYIQIWNQMMAAALIGMAPTLILFLIFQRYFVQGVVMSGLKG